MTDSNLQHDSAYKSFFSDPQMVKSLLLDFVPEKFVSDFDFDTLERCNSSYVTTDLKQRHDDIVWRLRWKENWCYVYLMLEFQSSQDRWMPLRILAYTALLWQDLVKTGAVRSGDLLPPVFPVVIYNGAAAWNVPLNIRDLVGQVPPELEAYQASQKHIVLDVLRLSKSEVDNAKGISTVVIRSERASTEQDLQAVIAEARKLLAGEEFAFLREAYFNWLMSIASNKLNLENLNLSQSGEGTMLAERFAQWEEEFFQNGVKKGISQGFSQGRAEGLTEGLSQGLLQGISSQQNTLVEMLEDRFGEVPQDWQRDISQIDETATLGNLIRAVYKVTNAEEFSSLLQACFKKQ